MALFVEDFITSRTVTSRCEIFLTRPNCIPDESGTKRDSNLDFLELYKFTPDLCQVYLLEIPDCDPDKFIFESTYSKKIHLSLILNKVKDGKLRYKLKSPRWHEVSFQQSNGRLSQFVIKITEEEESPWFQTFYDCLKNTIDLIKSENPVAPISTFVLVAVSDQDPFPLERKVNVTDVKLSKNSRIKSWVPQIFKRKPKNITRPHSVSGEGTDSKETNTKLAKRPNSLSVVSIPALDPRYRSHSDSNNNQSSFNDHNQSNNLSGVRFVQDRKSSCETSPQPFQPGAYTPGIAADFLQRSKSLEVIHLTANDNWALHKISPSDSEKEESPIQEEIPQRLESILESLKKEDLLREITIVENKETPKPMITPRGKSAENMAAKGDNLKKVAALLQAAISEGDQMTAQQCATNLAAKMAKVTITIEYEEPQSKDKEFSIKVYIEDKETAAGSINLKVKTTDTIRDLKNKMLLKHTFPIEIQRWIIGRRLPLDHETLAKCGVKTEGHSVYLYLVSAKSVGLTKEDFQNRMARLLKEEPPVPPQPPPPPPHHPAGVTGDYMSMQGLMTPQPPPSGKPMPGRQQSFPSPAAAPVSAHGAGGRQVVGPPAGHQIPNERPVVTPNAPIPPGQRINPNQPVHNLDSVTPLELLPSPGREPVMHPSDYQEGEPQLIQGWCCPACTFINVPTRPGCAICTQPRPPDYEIPDGYVMSEEERTRLEREKLLEKQAREAEELRLEREQVESQRNFENLLEADEQDLIPNTTEFECPVCFETIGPGGGVVLRECLHSFCKTCLMNAVQYTEEAILRCPFVDSNYSCEGVLQSREIKALVTEEEYDRFLQRSLMTAESQEANSFHCKTPDCRGWCIYEDHVNFFKCPVCSKENCLTCKAQHQSMNCKQYQEDIKRRASNDSAAKQTQLMIDQMMKEGNALKCPKCDVIVMKKDGCDWVKCSICKTEICWVTKGFRWGSHGFGDITGGCLCRVNGQKCHPNCNNCH